MYGCSARVENGSGVRFNKDIGPQTNGAPVKHDFGGHFDSDGGPQLVGNIISTSGGPINIGVNLSTSYLQRSLRNIN